jgi:hypothetical protein
VEGRENGKGKNSKNDVAIISHNNKGSVEKGMSQPVIIVDQDANIDISEKEGNELVGGQLKSANQEKNNKGAKLGARVTGSLKGRTTSKNTGRATLENIVENIEKNQLANIFKEQFQQVRESGNNNGTTNVIMGFNSQMGLQVGLSMNGESNVPRPPDLLNVPPLLISPPLTHNREDTNVERKISWMPVTRLVMGLLTQIWK